MKIFLIVITTFISSVVYGQSQPITRSKWINDDLGYISFYEDQVQFDFDGREILKRFKLSKDSLIMVDQYTTSADNYSKTHIDLFKFTVSTVKDKFITISPVDINAKKLVKKSSYRFTNQKYRTDPSIKLKRLVFTSGYCYGECPVMKLDIDSAGNYYLEAEKYTGKYIGSFKGYLSGAQQDSLNYLLQHSDLKKMATWKQKAIVMDTPPYTLNISYGNKSILIDTNYPPLNIYDLISFLSKSYKNVLLAPDHSKHSFD